QGQVVATPLGMATVAATIGRGRVVTPFIVVDQGGASNPRPAQPLSSAEGSALRSLMRSVVTDGSARFLDGLPGKPVLAKTGTAEYGSGNPPPIHAWMIALQGDLAVAVFVEKGESGARTAGPVLEDFLRRVAS
ncbi:MAG: penicillin-binding transpeptidase domain-containing protein, partial [Nostocoides sp.]